MFQKIHCSQGSNEWLTARLGLFTASEFDKILTPKKLQLSSTWKKEVNKKIAQRIIGREEEEFQGLAMLRGQSMEFEALEFFNFSFGYDFQKVGFFHAVNEKNESLGYGCSPDGVDEIKRMGLELKCPLAHTHIGYLTENKLPEEYLMQVQGSMLVTGYDKWVFGSYHPDFPCLRIEVLRDEELISNLKQALDYCVDAVNAGYKKLMNNER